MPYGSAWNTVLYEILRQWPYNPHVMPPVPLPIPTLIFTRKLHVDRHLIQWLRVLRYVIPITWIHLDPIHQLNIPNSYSVWKKLNNYNDEEQQCVHTKPTCPTTMTCTIHHKNKVVRTRPTTMIILYPRPTTVESACNSHDHEQQTKKENIQTSTTSVSNVPEQAERNHWGRQESNCWLSNCWRRGRRGWWWCQRGTAEGLPTQQLHKTSLT